MADPKASSSSSSYSTDPALYVYTSLTAGSSHIVTATSRLETILRANKVPFKAVDIAVDEKARMLWGRRAGKDASGRVRKLPGLVQMGLVLGDLVEIEEWNEYGELKQNVTIYYDDFTIPPKSQAPPPPPAAAPKSSKPAAPPAAAAHPPAAPPLPQAAGSTKKPSAAGAANTGLSIAEEAAKKAKQVHLNSLREKVYGKKDKDGADAAKDAKPASSNPAKKDPVESASEGLSSLSISADGRKEKEKAKAVGGAALQSPTTGTWRAGAPSDKDDDGGVLRQVLQSPTSGTWKADGALSEYHGSTIAAASAEEIAAVEKAEAIPEASSEEEEDDEDEKEEDDDDDDDEEEESGKDEKSKKEDKKQDKKK
ncbi:hypothetical protein AAE478_000967 [Parahypoxylon ruwenzoriense]